MAITIIPVPNMFGLLEDIALQASTEEVAIPKADYSGDQRTDAANKVAEALMGKYVHVELTQYHYNELLFKVRAFVFDNQ